MIMMKRRRPDVLPPRWIRNHNLSKPCPGVRQGDAPYIAPHPKERGGHSRYFLNTARENLDKIMIYRKPGTEN